MPAFTTPDRFKQIKPRRFVTGMAWAVCYAIFSHSAVSAQAEYDDYETNVRPLLIKYCVKCHGAEKQESGLRLDSSEYWQKGGISGPALVAGQPDQSLMLIAVKKTNPDLSMPPGSGRLSREDIEKLEQWILKGAKAPRNNVKNSDQRLSLDEAKEFWSLKPLQTVLPPSSSVIDRWSWSPIDRFIMSRLEQSGLAPVSDADKRTLIRRATFDLTGLPPTPEEISSYLSDDAEDAYTKVVERLLASTAYGERWGRHWLDIARYSDTAGDGADYPVREAYKYRNWVIRSMNSDKPYDQFVREQLAGDILAETAGTENYADLVTATGFLAVGKRYGYKPSPDYQHLDFADAIDSIGRSLMGLSLGCARCHDHKYDPITAEDYYALYGIFQSTTWAFPGCEEQKRPSEFPATVPPEEMKRLKELRKEDLASLASKMEQLKRERRKLDIGSRAGGSDLDLEHQRLGEPLQPPWVSSGPVLVEKDAQSPFANVHPEGTRGVRISGGLKTDGIRYVFEPGLRAEENSKIYFNIDFRISADSRAGVTRFYLGQGVVQSLAVEFSVTESQMFLKNGNEWELLTPIKDGYWYSLQIEIDTASRNYRGSVATLEGSTSFVDKRTAPEWNGIADCFICDGFGHKDGEVLSRDIDNVALTSLELLPSGRRLEIPKLTVNEVERLKEIDQLLGRHEGVKQKILLEPVYPVAYGVSEGEEIDAFVQLRGEPDNVGDEVPRRFIEVLGGDKVPDGGSGRLQLADWITSDRNPLTARVFVNRVWQWHFGRGLVDTPSDFGSRGEKPSHPKLLEWLTRQFIKNNWSLKYLHRLIMHSRVYQLSSEDEARAVESDPENRLHWRFSRKPLDAESMRDAMLAVSGNLDRAMPGAHPFPDVGTWNYTIHNPFYAVYDTNHRSVYLMQQRNRRHPYLELFDAADPNVSIGKRQQTITPTQALYLMNSEFVHAQAHRLAHRIAIKYPSRPERIRYAFELALGKSATTKEIRSATEFLARYILELGRSTEGDAQKQAWEAFSRVLLTSNEFLFVD